MKLTTLFLALFLAGCMTLQARDVETSGFLSDYSLLKAGGSDEALLVYHKPNLSLRAYDKAILEPVTAWRSQDSQLGDVSDEDVQELLNLLRAEIEPVLRKHFQLVKQPGPGTLRFRFALTEAGESTVVLDLVSTVVPVGRAISAAKMLLTGTHGFVGSASVEAELTDSQTGELLAAAVDRRVGGKSLRGVTGSWSDVHDSFKVWGERLGTRLADWK
jgi:hypothetical protein